MRFNSLIYFAFLAVVVAVLWALPSRARRWWLLAASYAFYASWHWPYLVLLTGCAALTHWGGQWIVAGADRARRGRWVLAANVLLLVLFKYLDWLVGNVNTLAGWLGFDIDLPLAHWILPLGISFYVFEAISYTVDLIRKRERIHSFWDFQLFIAFFPKLIAGPIMRAKELLPQIEGSQQGLTSRPMLEAFWLLTSGFFVKVALADNLTANVDAAFSRNVDSLGSADVALMAMAFGLQIYFDFSGYTRMAIGSARLCGISLVENFNYPYSATSPVDFWNRWHMSLSRWVRDYLFFPLLGKATTLPAMCRAAILSMTICGIWHGAGWPFLLWGAYHGLLIAGYHLLTFSGRQRSAGEPASRRIPLLGLASMLVTYGLVSVGWLFFRSNGLTQAMGLLGRLATPWQYSYRALSGTFYLQTALLVLAVWTAPYAARLWKALAEPALEQPRFGIRLCAVSLAQGLAMGLMVASSLVYLHGQTAFIYFQF